MNNVVQISKLTGLSKVYEIMQEFVNEAGVNSKSTKTAYLSDLKQYLITVYGNTNVNTDLFAKTFGKKQLQKYRSLLVENKLQANSINRKIVVLQEFAKHLYTLGYDIDYISIKTVNKLKSKKNSYEVLDYHEAMKIINWFKTNEQVMPIEKYYYSALAFDTGVRAEALNTLTPQSFTWKDTEVILKGVDKGNKQFIKSISLEFANNLFRDLKLDKESNGQIFNFSGALRYKMMNRAKKALGWSNRNITFHSFKKGAVNYAYDMTKDIQVAREVGSHASVTTTQIYIDDNKETFQGAISNNQNDSKDVRFSDFTKEQLIEAILNSNESTKVNLKVQLTKLK